MADPPLQAIMDKCIIIMDADGAKITVFSIKNSEKWIGEEKDNDK